MVRHVAEALLALAQSDLGLFVLGNIHDGADVTMEYVRFSSQRDRVSLQPNDITAGAENAEFRLGCRPRGHGGMPAFDNSLAVVWMNRARPAVAACLRRREARHGAPTFIY